MNNYNNTPLRYPGGKSVLTEYFKSFIKANNLKGPIYAEPFSGGAGAAINLLMSDSVQKIILNDADYSVYSFWYSLKYNGNEFLELFDSTNVDLDQWFYQKEIFDSAKKGLNTNKLAIGFSTFFLNRCNRSGILTAGPIGGKSEEAQSKANYKVDARFNKIDLRKRLVNIIQKANQFEIYNFDVLDFLNRIINNQDTDNQLNTFVYLDPPYYSQGSSLYLNYYQKNDHKVLRDFLTKEQHLFKWLLSYDNVDAIRELYSQNNQYQFYINYSAQNSKLGSELLVKSKNCLLPESNIIKRLNNKKTIELTEIM